MLLAALVISGRDWLTPAAGLLGVSLLLLFWGYRRAPVRGALRAACFGLKLLGVAALLACLLDPLWSGERARPGANYFAVVSDNSQSLQTKDPGELSSRATALSTQLISNGAWQVKLAQDFQLRRFYFDSRLQSSRDFSELKFDGRASALAGALRSVKERFQGQPLAGVLLLTDGNATDLGDRTLDYAGLPPIYPVLIGSETAIKDVAVGHVHVTQTSFEDAPVSIHAEVTAEGYRGESIVAQLFESAAPGATNATSPSGAPVAPVAELTETAPRSGEKMVFRFQVRPTKPGVSFYRLEVAAKGEMSQMTNSADSAEAALANNTRLVVADRGREPFRVLYVSGRPNWEYKFLRRALEEDEQIQLRGLVRIAKREPKFDFRGRTGESSNPLFRGFGNQSKEEIERYDQPVLIRLNTQDQEELRAGFPKTAEELYAYHAIIIDDLEGEFFTADQMSLVQKFVSERGGGLLMLGGAESFQEGKYHRTPIGDLLPVYLERAESRVPPEEIKLHLTREGWLQPWIRLRNQEADEQTRLAEMTSFSVLNFARATKPGASVLATVSDSAGTLHPALITQRYGRGRSAALMIGDLWHWGLADEQAHVDMDKAWRQMIRWLVADVPNRTELQVESNSGESAQAARLQVRVRDKKFQPMDGGEVKLSVQYVPPNFTPGAGGTTSITNHTITLTAEPSLNEAGLYEATFVPRETGGYIARANVTEAQGVETSRAEAGWTVNFAAEEFRSLKPNRSLLETLARQTGGELVALNRLEEFARALPKRTVPITESWTMPLWHQSTVFLFALGCFVAEWGLRRWKGLA